MDHYANRVIRGYQFHERIGTGGFGAVYRASQAAVGREVAVKVILPEYANHPNFIRRFEVEAQLVARLEHPYIVPLYDYWREPDGAYLVMRLLTSSVRATLEHSPWSVEATLRLLDQVTAALGAAHRQQVIHRDIKPDNILLDEDGNAYLADFGIAKNLNVTDTTEEGLISGSPAYLAPEQIRGEAVSPQTDIYSVGLVVYEILIGHKPFGDNTLLTELISKHLNEPVPSVKVQRPDLPVGLDEVIQTCTAKDPAQRYADTQALASAFRDAVKPETPAITTMDNALTPRELEILRLFATGLSNLAIAEQLFLSQGTVKWYLKQIYRKLDVHSRVQAIQYAWRLGLVPDIESILPYEQRQSARRVEAEATAIGIRPIVEDTALLPPENPYKGLRAFQEADAVDFFGRQALIDHLLLRMQNQDSRFLAVVGPSGSGKSSLVNSGLIPALRQGSVPGSERWFIAEILPGTHPLEELEAALLRVAANTQTTLLAQLREDERGLIRAVKRILPEDHATELVLVIDQFEELFTLVEEKSTRLHFLNLLVNAIGDPHSRIHVIITLRADFYDRPLLYRKLAEHLRKNTELVVPLTSEELEQTIVGPAQRVGMSLEPGLLELIVKDVGEQVGALPLLQYALTELFERRQGRNLTVAAYQASGGVLGALARRADELYDSLDAEGQTAARQLFLRLVTPGEGAEDSRRRVMQSEFTVTGLDSNVLDDVMNLYGQYRLLTFDRDPITRSPTSEVAHEALLRTWGRLREWLNVSREDLRMHRRLATAAGEWAGAESDRSFLADGARLEQFIAWSDETTLRLNEQERSFLENSLIEREGRREVERARRVHEAALQQRAANQLRYLVAVLAAFLLVSVGLSVVALNSRAEAIESQAQAVGNAATAVANLNRADSLRLASDANGLLPGIPNNAELSTLLAIRSLKTIYSPQADVALMKAVGLNYTRRLLAGHTSIVIGVAYSPDGKTVVTGSGDNTARLWDSLTGQLLRKFSPCTTSVTSVDFSPDGKTLAAGCLNGQVTLWDAVTGKDIDVYPSGPDKAQVTKIAFSPDSRVILVVSSIVQLWDIQTHQEARRFAGFVNGLYTAALSPDGKTILTASGDHILRMWDVQTGQEIRRFTNHATAVNSVAFSPDSKTILIGTGDGGGVWLLDAQTGQEIRRFIGHLVAVGSVAVSPDGLTVLTGSFDNTARLWDIQTGQELRRFTGHRGWVTSVAYSPDGKNVLTGSQDNTARLWNVEVSQQPRILSNHTDAVISVTFSPDGKTAVTGSVDRTARLWDVQTGQERRRFIGHTDTVSSVAFSPDGKTLLTGSYDYTARLWDVQTGQELHRFVGHTNRINGLAFSPDGKTVGTTSVDNTARLWDVQTGQELHRFVGIAVMIGVAFSPDGKTILTGSGENTAVLWDVQRRQELHRFVGRTNPEFRMAFQPDGTTVLPEGQAPDSAQTNPVVSVAFSPDGKTVLTGGAEGTARLWDVQTGQELHRFIGTTNPVVSVAFSPDGKTVLTGGMDSTVRLWDVQTGQETRILSGLAGTLNSVALSPDGKTILISSSDKTARLWDTDYRDLIALACTRVFQDFAANDRTHYEITDLEPTCPQFGTPSRPMPPTTTRFPTRAAPMWTALPSRTLTATYTGTPTSQ